jgi:diguanylate cyclase (GGDEF)-like protein
MMNQVALALRSAQAHGELRTQARTDALTGLANRSSFTSALRAALDLGVAGSVSVLFIDLDDFKNVNDVLGHAAGDELLRQVAARLRECTRPGDVCARLGGDEFAILLEDRTGSTAMAVAQRLVEAVGAPVRLQGQVARVGASVGVTHATNETDVEQLVQQADVAMYAAKANGKNRVQAFETGLLRSDGRAKLERQLANAAADGELVVHYQPIMSLSDGRCVAVEALVRWQHPERGLLQPDDFIEIAERTGAIIDIGDLVLRSACAQASAWRAEHPDSSLAVHVNVAAAQLIDEHFAETVTQCMAEHSIAPRQLVLEIAESVVLDLPTAIDRVNDLVGLGAAIAIDDFGTGYSALTTLRMLPVHIVKIDESFIAGSPSNRADQAVIEAIVQMAGRLELRTIAEGVERLDQQQFLRTVGADSAQGHLYLRPSPAEDFARWLRTHLAGAPAAASDRPTVTPLKPRRIG